MTQKCILPDQNHVINIIVASKGFFHSNITGFALDLGLLCACWLSQHGVIKKCISPTCWYSVMLGCLNNFLQKYNI